MFPFRENSLIEPRRCEFSSESLRGENRSPANNTLHPSVQGGRDMLLLILLVVLIFGFGYGGYRVGPGLGYYGGGGVSLVLTIVLLLLLLKVI
jgi:hypothetical protein